MEQDSRIWIKNIERERLKSMNDKVIVRAPKIYKEILSGRGGGVRR